ncbi:Uncharacterized protein HZ326_19909 [Fusarium oxysporum f. sp. albedinis]|nr:Uncharacterized protein HZ326_19909 [Fusarium oxysporum f. sp. albedinis]
MSGDYAPGGETDIGGDLAHFASAPIPTLSGYCKDLLLNKGYVGSIIDNCLYRRSISVSYSFDPMSMTLNAQLRPYLFCQRCFHAPRGQAITDRRYENKFTKLKQRTFGFVHCLI